MRSAYLAMNLSCLLIASAPCHAGGFFRRLPEVGEWARYDMVMLALINAEDALVGAPELPEMTGTLTLKCVGEETIDEERHLWLEARVDLTDTDGSGRWLVAKLLVPADQVVDGDLSQHIVRAWTTRDDLAEPQAFTLDVGSFNEDPSWFVMLVMFPVTLESNSGSQNKTVTIDGEEVRLSHNETGPLPDRDLDDASVTGEATWWPSADHAFGVAAAEQMWTISLHEPIAIEMEYAMQMDLVATGTDAVSELPDHN